MDRLWDVLIRPTWPSNLLHLIILQLSPTSHRTFACRVVQRNTGCLIHKLNQLIDGSSSQRCADRCVLDSDAFYSTVQFAENDAQDFSESDETEKSEDYETTNATRKTPNFNAPVIDFIQFDQPTSLQMEEHGGSSNVCATVKVSMTPACPASAASNVLSSSSSRQFRTSRTHIKTNEIIKTIEIMACCEAYFHCIPAKKIPDDVIADALERLILSDCGTSVAC